MNPSSQRYILNVMSGRQRGIGAAALRTLLRIGETPYATVMRLRNRLYDAGVLHTHVLPRPVISIGNITTGGTGKTPVVRWLGERLRERRLRPAVLMRGYTVGNATKSEEQIVLHEALNAPGQSTIPVIANPDRIAGASQALAEHSDVDVFLLDDGFQHRRVARQFNLVLINAADPFGHGHVLPRGLLREPLSGLRRADAILLTRADQVTPDQLQQIERMIRQHNPVAPLHQSEHRQIGLRRAGTRASAPIDHALDWLAGRRFFSFSGIGSPEGFELQVISAGGIASGHRWFPDHHAYTSDDVANVLAEARQAGAEVILTTEKDWVKVADLPGARDSDIPIIRVEMQIAFRGDDEVRLLDQVLARVATLTPPAAL